MVQDSLSKRHTIHLIETSQHYLAGMQTPKLQLRVPRDTTALARFLQTVKIEYLAHLKFVFALKSEFIFRDCKCAVASSLYFL